MTRLILVRHGESMANSEGRFAGQKYDAELSELGHRQAELTAEYIAKNYDVDEIYASDLKRAYSTAEHIAKKAGIGEIHKESGFREIFAGKWEGMTFSEIDSAYTAEYSVWKNNIGLASCTGGESVADLFARISDTVSSVARENPDKTVVIATHATPIRVMECIWRNMEREEMKNIPWVTNASVTVAEYENGKFRLVSVSEDAHLAELKTALPANV